MTARAAGDVHVAAPALVGRDAELTRIVQAVSSPPAVVVVEGEAGIGKTRLITELATHSELAGRWVLVGSCRQLREPFPFGPLIEALRTAELPARIRGLSPVSGALRPLLPELAAVLPEPPPPVEPAAEQHRRFRGLAELLSALGPAVLVLEDLHRADSHTVDFLSYLVGRAWPPGLALVLTLRDDEASPELATVLADLPTPVRVPLEPLDVTGTAALATALLGTGPVAWEFATDLWRYTAGLPLVVAELAALLRERGQPAAGAGRWPVPATIQQRMWQRVRHLPTPARRVVEAAAVLRTPQPAALVTAVAGGRSRPARQGLMVALEARVLVERDGRVGFRHLLAADAVYDKLTGPRRQELHGRAAGRLRVADPVPLPELAHHLRHAGARRAWAETAEQAADQAVRRGDDAAAAQLLEEVLRHAELAAPDRQRIAVKLGHSAADARWRGRAADLLSMFAGHELPAELRGELELLRSLLLDTQELTSSQRMRAAVAGNPAVSPELRAWAMALLSFPALAGVPEAERRRWREQALALLPRFRDPVMETFVLGKLAMAMLPVGDRRWRDLAERIQQRLGEASRHPREAKASYSIGFGACYAGHHQLARQWLDRAAAAVSPRAGQRWEIRSGRALLDFCTGAWEGLEPELDRLRFQLGGRPMARVDAETAAGGLALARGELETAVQILTGTVTTAAEVGCGDLLPLPTGLLIRAALAGGDHDAALAQVDRLRELVEQYGVWAPAVRALPPAVEALTVTGRHRQAHALVDWFAAELADRDAPLAPAGLDHARGLVAAADGDQRTAAEQLERAAAAYRRLACPYEAAQAREQAARSRLSGGRPVDERAAALLRRAYDGYVALGATRDRDRAAGLARRCGLPLPSHHRGGRRSYGDALSPREREVAELAAQGCTNAEIAERLFVSVKTVEGHLSAVLRKLGIRTRTAIIHQLPGAHRSKNPGFPS